jgi:Sulfotransferase domain
VRKVLKGRLPDFIGVGPGRCGTTWLDGALRGHVGLPRGVKETDFFVRYYSKGLRWYQEFFRNHPPDLVVGEICPTYWLPEEARQRISQHIPNCRIICTFRDPVERIYSDYRLMRRNVWTRAPFEEAVATRWRMAETNRYAHYLRAWQDRFGKEKVLACLYDDLKTDQQTYLDRICGFIGAPRIDLTRFPVNRDARHAITHAPRSHRLAQNARHLTESLHAREAHRAVDLLEWLGILRFCFEGGEKFGPLPPDVEARVRRRFIPEVEAFEEIIGRDLSAWKRPGIARADGFRAAVS